MPMTGWTLAGLPDPIEMATTSKTLKAIAPPTNAGEPRPDGAESAGPALLPHGSERRRDSGRVLAGIVVLLVLGVAVLNVVLFRNASLRAEHDGWGRLEASADLRRDELANAVGAFRREALSTLDDPVVHDALLRMARDPQASFGEGARHEIAQDRERFGFSGVQLLDADGDVVWQTGEPLSAPRSAAKLVRRSLDLREDLLGDPLGSRLRLAAPLEDGRGMPDHAVLFQDRGDGITRKLLERWPGMGASSRAYLVRQDGDEAVILAGCDTSNFKGLAAGRRMPLSSPEATVPAMAATRIESRAEYRDAKGRRMWAVTRALPELGWGLVATESRADGMNGLGATWGMLVLLDVGLVLFVIGMVFVWRRVYASGLARREAEIVERDERRMRAVFDTAFDAIVLFDAEGRIRTANRAAEELFGRSASELESLPFFNVLTYGTGTAGTLLPVGGAITHSRVVQPDGTEVPVEFSIGTTGTGDELFHAAIVRDIRERVESERLVREAAAGLETSNRRLEEVNAQLSEASRLKSEFLANTSHELRTPLNGMIGFLQLVLDGLCDSPEEERDYLRQGLACSRHLLGLINDVLDIAKIEAGKLTLEIERLDVQQLFDEVYTLTHVQAAQRGVHLVFESDLEPGEAARGDFGKVKQVLVNLVGNSLKFTERGSITVRARSRSTLGHLIIEVQDTGVGIPPDRQRLIFEKFVQADGSTTRRYGGTGLGLAISRSLVELMGGIIGVHSAGEGHGTLMYFSLPLWRGEDSLPAPGPENDQDRIGGVAGGSLVLIVEDDAVSRRLLTAVLQKTGYRTVEAENAEAAWVLVRRLHPACVVLDYALSCGDGASLRTGWDLAQRLTSDPATRHIPIVFVTGFDGELREKLRSTAFTRKPEHMLKPIEPMQLIGRIESLVGPAQDRMLRVLLADDDATVAAYVRKVLPAGRFHLEIVNNGEQCLHVLRTQPKGFDILLLDLMMPEVSGYDVLREMTLSGLSPDLPVMVLTNFPEPRDESERQLLEQGLVIEIISKTDVHANPRMLPAALQRYVRAMPGVGGEDEQAEAA